MAQPIDMDERRRARAAGVAAGTSLKDGDGDGTSGGMEARIAKLEADMEHVKKSIDRLVDVPTKLAVLEERVSHLPGKGFIVTAAIATIGGVTALMGLLQHLGLMH
jgi:hypothetical protein